MSRGLGKLPPCSLGSISQRQSFISSAFSTSAGGGGGGWGRGRGGGGFGSDKSPIFGFTPNQSESGDAKDDESASRRPHSGIGNGRGSGKPFQSSDRPSIFPFMADNKGRASSATTAGRGQGVAGPISAPPPPPPPPQSQQQMPPPPQHQQPDRPKFFVKEEESPDSSGAANLHSSILSVLTGAGRGKPIQTPPVRDKPKEENRHIRATQTPQTGWRREDSGGAETSRPPGQRFSRDDRVQSRGGTAPWRGRGFSDRGRGGRGRGRGGRGRGRGRGDGAVQEDVDDKYADILNIGDDAAAEKLAQELGPDIVSQIAEGIEEMAPRVFPARIDDAYLDALDTNLKIECEEEYMMGEFDMNPDIDEKPPIPLRDALEKMKPFLMVYEGIESQEEWEEVMKETMEVRLPLIKEIVDHYGGPERVTAKQQHEELKRVAATLPQRTPNSVKLFTERAVQSLQSNPGWGFHKKCQFMDKLAYQVSKQYK